MTLVYMLTGLVIAGLLYMRFEAGFLKIDRVRLAEGQPILKIILLSDIHISRLKVREEAIRDAIKKEQPDILLMTGDYIEQAANIPEFMNFLKRIRHGHETFLCFGNHDYKALTGKRKLMDEWIRSLENLGVTVLENASAVYSKGNRKFNIVGIGDFRLGAPDPEKAFSSRCSGAAATIVISHNPDIALKIPPGKADYLFTGHFHGGQIWMPFGLEYRLLRNEKLCRMGIRKGLHDWKGCRLYISRGLGNVVFPLRFLSRPEITVFEL